MILFDLKIYVFIILIINNFFFYQNRLMNECDRKNLAKRALCDLTWPLSGYLIQWKIYVFMILAFYIVLKDYNLNKTKNFGKSDFLNIKSLMWPYMTDIWGHTSYMKKMFLHHAFIQTKLLLDQILNKKVECHSPCFFWYMEELTFLIILKFIMFTLYSEYKSLSLTSCKDM